MAYDVLTTSGINNLINNYIINEQEKRLVPLNSQKSKYQNLSTAYSTLSSKLTLLKTTLSDLKSTGTSSAFTSKTAASSNTTFLTAVANSSASTSSYSFRINQLAKSDVAISQLLASDTTNAISGTHQFVVKTGDGSTGEFTSNVEVTFGTGETNKTMMEKIRDAMNFDYAVVNSSAKAGTDTYSGGASTFKIDLNGTEKEITVNGGGTYSDLLDEMVTQINLNVSGVTAEKISDSPNPGDVKLQITVNDTTKYISISNVSGNDIVSDLNIGVTKEKGAAGVVTASVFTPGTGNSQFSITSKQSGLDNRIKSIYDVSSYSALTELGLNLNTTRTAFDQDTNTAGFTFADITSSGNQLNAKVNFNNIDMQRNSNTINDLATGVTFTLKSVMQTTDTDIVVSTSNDISAIKSKLNTFITRFNDIYSYLKTNSMYNSDTRGILTSDRNALTLTSDLKTVYSDVIGLPSGDISKLAQIGISFDSTNGLSISDNTLLEQKISDSISEVESLFNSTNGIANSLYNKISPYLGSGGYLANSRSSFDSNISHLNDKLTRTQNSIDKGAEVLRKRYEQLQAQLAAIITMQEWFSTGGFFSS